MGMKSDPLAGKWACWDDIDENEFLDIELSADRALYLSHTVRTEGITAK